MSVRRNAFAPPAVADHSASAGVSGVSRTARARQTGIDVVYDEPGLQSVARATVAPASSRARASGYGERVENSAPGNRVATVSESASALTSASDRYVQWSALAAFSSTASWIPCPAVSWLAWIRIPRPVAAPARRISRDWSTSKAPRSQNTSTQRAYGRAAASMSPQTSRTYSSASVPAGTTWAPRYVVSSVNPAAMRRDRCSSGTVSPYPLLISIVVVPWRAASWTSRAVLARSTSSGAARVAVTVVWIPPPV